MGGSIKAYEVPWEVDASFDPNEPFKSIQIKTDIKFTIRGELEKLHVTFNNRSLLQDLSENSLSSEKLIGKALRSIFISNSEKAGAEAMGAGFQAASLTTFVGSIGINLFQSFAMGSFWILVDTIQILTYLPLIDCLVPANLEIVLSDYFTIAEIKIPFDLVPEWIPNPKTYLEFFEIIPFSDRFELNGYDSLSFVYNFAEDLLTWSLLIFLYLGLRFLSWLFPQIKYCRFVLVIGKYESLRKNMNITLL